MKGIRFYRHMALALCLEPVTIKAQDLGISHFRVQETGVTLEVDVPQGWGHVKLVTTQSLFEPFESLLASGEVKRLPGKAVFTIPKSGETTFLSVGAGKVRLLRLRIWVANILNFIRSFPLQCFLMSMR